MLTPKQNFLETLKKDGHPDRLVRQYEYGAFLPGDPIENLIRGSYSMGMEPKKDAFGTELMWPEGYVAVMPHVTDENKVIPDITRWREYLHVPEVAKYVNGEEVWKVFHQRIANVDRDQQLLMPFMHTGLFERLHFLMGFEDLFINFYEEPDDLKDLIQRIADYRFEVFKTLIDNVHPDLILSHDDWGSKTSLFIQPDMWREFIKPHYKKLYGYCHDQGIIVVHHADSFLEPIVEDMIECHVDVWQGVLPQNNIDHILDVVDGRMTIQGGLEMGIVDRADSTEEEIRANVRQICEKYGPRGHFIPSVTYGGPGTLFPEHDVIINDEIDKYNMEVYGVCSGEVPVMF
ncbi:MAG: uroporphyrinogen decarboxylase (URO-D) [Oscillospiraceae bacterium]|nr:uroporphyrinogen decarboxylase (URO-D) [Oscillospiraceae bacterium]